MMKKAFIFLSALALLLAASGCKIGQIAGGSPAGQNPDGVNVIFTKDDFPRLDGSTANIPLALLITERLLGVSEEEADAAVNFSTTPIAYLNLIDHKADLLLVYEADDSVKNRIAGSGVQLEYHPIGRDALVFIANDGNPVTSLTEKQVQDIYQGKIKNWNALGGEDREIAAYQRSQTSGSQALMVKLVMKGLPLMDAPTERYPGEMGGLIDAIAGYYNTQNAIGYSVYYYVKNMYSQPGLKLMEINGINPSNDTIADGTYPFINEFYAVIRKSEPKNSNARKLLNWLLSNEGTKTVADAGYVGLTNS